MGAMEKHLKKHIEFIHDDSDSESEEMPAAGILKFLDT